MAKINCVECGEPVSDAALSCPHCGYPMTVQNEMLLNRRNVAVSQISSEGSLFALRRPFSLVQIIPCASIIRDVQYTKFVDACSDLNAIRFFSGRPATPRRVSTGVMMCSPDNVKAQNLGEFVHVSEDGMVNHGASYYLFGKSSSTPFTYFAFDAFIRGLKAHLTRITELYTQTEIPQPHWLLISLLGVRDTHLGSTAFDFPGVDNGPCLEDDIMLRPIRITAEDLESDKIYFSVANSIWHTYGEQSYPAHHLKTIFNGR